MKRNKSSKAWVHEQMTDHWVQRAHAEGYRSRAAFKLIEIDERDKLIKRGMTVVDLGAAPGGWSQVASQRVHAEGCVIAVDLLEMQPIHGVKFLQGDFSEDIVLQQLKTMLPAKPVDLVICDMSPNLSGITCVDQARMGHLSELALEFASQHLFAGGSFLLKAFQGTYFDSFRRAMNEKFIHVMVRKPKASRDKSNEVYLLGRALR